MSSIKKTLSTEWLSVCGGCHVAIVDLHEQIIDVLDSVQILRCPVLTDTKDYPKADIGIISGAIRSRKDRRAAEMMRETCTHIIAFGTCAVYGGISGAAFAHETSEILETVYVDNKTTRTRVIPDKIVPKFENNVVPVSNLIDVDFFLPGCPPHPKFIFNGLRSLLSGTRHQPSQKTVCGSCTRAMIRIPATTRVLANHEGAPDPDTCLLSQGYICLGSATLDRCLAPCPAHGVTCTGCCGPSLPILTEPNRDIRTEIADQMAYLTSIPRDAVISEIEASAKSHYAYAMATEMIHKKPTFLLHQWISGQEHVR